METKQTKVTLLSYTMYPVETIFCEWRLSRSDDELLTPAEVQLRVMEERSERAETKRDEISAKSGIQELEEGVPELAAEAWAEQNPGPFEREVRETFEKCVDMKVPIAETIGFVFAVENMSIALREQWVRHRIGHKFDGQFGFDPIPNQHDSSWWSQTFRAKNLGSFAKQGDYLLPESVAKDQKLTEAYHSAMKDAEKQYNYLVSMGVPLEDARNVLPLGVQHAMTWSCNLSSLMHILSKRGCWIAQLGMWEPVVRGIVNELAEKIDPYFRTLINPPCISGEKFVGCKFHKENEEYLAGRDPHYPCPLWLGQHPDRADSEICSIAASAGEDALTWDKHEEVEGGEDGLKPIYPGIAFAPVRPFVEQTIEAEREGFINRTNKYAELWGRNPATGERKRLA